MTLIRIRNKKTTLILFETTKLTREGMYNDIHAEILKHYPGYIITKINHDHTITGFDDQGKEFNFTWEKGTKKRTMFD